MLLPGCCLKLSHGKTWIKAATVSPSQSPTSVFRLVDLVTLVNVTVLMPVNVSFCLLSTFCSSGGCSASPHDPEQRVDIIALDGVATGRDHLVLGFTH